MVGFALLHQLYKLYAVRKAVNQKDAFIGAWSSNGHIFQVIVTEEHLHLITQISPLLLTGNDEEKIKRILVIASERRSAILCRDSDLIS
ncbi:MAG: hypothetical protein HC877_05445 [Thioploca sp.]|nr:hypothetical protein [Thioploca sp.]